MCDDLTAADDDAALARKGLSRREFGAMSGAAAMAGYASLVQAAIPAASLTEGMVEIQTPDGKADAFFVHPAKSAAPGVILWPDIGGLRDAFKTMARRLAGAGYAVLAVNHYYRGARAPVLSSFAEWRTPAGQAKIQPLSAQLTVDAINRDAAAFVAWLGTQRAVNQRRKVGSQGYCMTGSYAIRTAAAAPDRVGAVASFHGGGLVGTQPDSPSQLLAHTKASYLFAIAKNDDARAPGDKDALRAAAAAAGRPAEIEVYGGDHGWTVPDSPVYNAVEGDRAWARLLALYAKL
jgi:carboxymethylenebutenolidase